MICEKIGPQHLERKAILYAYGKTHVVAGYDGAALRTRSCRKARDEWLALIPGSHEGYISWERSEDRRSRR